MYGLMHLTTIWPLWVGENNAEMFDKRWNKSRVVHMIGKDILRFHAIILSCRLLSAGEKLPSDSIVAHGWWTSEGEKMSKSRNNVVDPYKEIKKYGVDAFFRYYLLRASFGTDGDYSTKSVITRLNSRLSKWFGKSSTEHLECIKNILIQL